jgi:hypothetical protein
MTIRSSNSLITYHAGTTCRCLLLQAPRACQSTYGQVPIRATAFEALTGNDDDPGAVDPDDLVSTQNLNDEVRLRLHCNICRAS